MIEGTPGNDLIDAKAGNNVINGNGGNDCIISANYWRESCVRRSVCAATRGVSVVRSQSCNREAGSTNGPSRRTGGVRSSLTTRAKPPNMADTV
jgi:hypothetical protein